jgi:hypothetical protein
VTTTAGDRTLARPTANVVFDPLTVLLVTTAARLVGGVGLDMLAAPLTPVISRTGRQLHAANRLSPPDSGPPADHPEPA